MKKYVIDQILFLMLGIAIMMILPRICGYVLILTIIFESIAVLSVGFLCRHILVLPLDLIISKRCEDVFFSRMCNVENYEFFKGKCYCEWKFYSSRGTVKVLVPVALSEEEIRNMERPRVDQKVRVCYYRFSKILYSWEKL